MAHPKSCDEEEWWVLNETRKFSCAASLCGRAIKFESPDFKVDTPEGLVGIEVTEAIFWRDAAARTEFSKASEKVRCGEDIDLPSGAYIAADGQTMIAFAGAFRTDAPIEEAFRGGRGEHDLELLSTCIEKKCQPKYTSNWTGDYIQRNLIVYLNPASSVFVPPFDKLFETWRPAFSFYDCLYVLRSSGSEICLFSRDSDSCYIQST